MHYDLDEIAASSEDVTEPQFTPSELARGLSVVASQNSSSTALKQAVQTAQEIIGKPIDEVDENIEGLAIETLEVVKQEARRCYMQAKAHNATDLKTYKAISRLIDSVSANDYEKVVF